VRPVNKVSALLFRAICAGFSFLLLVAALLGSIELAAVNEELNTLEQGLKELKDENRILQAKLETSMSLEELERYATEELGMQRMNPGQIIYLELG